MEIINHPLGTEGSLDIKLELGKLIFTIVHNHASGNIAFTAQEDAGYFFDKLAAAIPGVFDDAIIAIIKAAVLKL